MARGAERPGIDTRTVGFAALGITVFLAGTVLALALAFPQQLSHPRLTPRDFPTPSVRDDERAERLALEAAQRARLSGRGGTLPIGRAMAMIVARGPKAFDPVTEAVP